MIPEHMRQGLSRNPILWKHGFLANHFTGAMDFMKLTHAFGGMDFMKSELPGTRISLNPKLRRHGFHEIQPTGRMDCMKSKPAAAWIS